MTMATMPDTVPDARQHVMATTHAHVRGEPTTPLYLTTGRAGSAIALLGAAAVALRATGQGDRLLVCTGQDFACLWHDTLRRGMTPFVRRALDAKRAVLIDGVQALRGEPFAQAELARVVEPHRLIVLAGRGHLHHVSAWSPVLHARLHHAKTICFHDGPCCASADVWEIVDQVAGYYGLTRRMLLSSRRTAMVVRARQMAMVLLREQGLTYVQVGQVLRRDHSTVLYGYAHIQQLSRQHPSVRHDLDTLRQCTCAA